VNLFPARKKNKLMSEMPVVRAQDARIFDFQAVGRDERALNIARG
jgi:hypothetical protein